MFRRREIGREIWLSAQYPPLAGVGGGFEMHHLFLKSKVPLPSDKTVVCSAVVLHHGRI
jgi:hypothetical protein